MAISTVTNRVAYQGDGTSAVFAFPYNISRSTDLGVFVFNSSGIQNIGIIQPQVINTNYTFSGTPDGAGIYPSGGFVVFNSTPNIQSQIVIFRSSVVTNDFVIPQFGGIPATSLNNEIDYLTKLVQRLQDQVSRAVRIPDGLVGTFDPTLAANLLQSQGKPLTVGSGAVAFTFDPVLTAPYIPNTVVIATTNSSITSLGGDIAGRLLTSNGSSAPSWQGFNLNGGSVSGVLPTANGGTGTGSSVYQGTLFYAGTSGIYTQLSGAYYDGVNTLVVGSSQPLSLKLDGFLAAPLRTTATGIVISGSTSATTELAGILPVANGGTGTGTNYTQFGIIYASSATQMATVPSATAGLVLTANGSSAPTFQTVAVSNAFATKTANYTATLTDRYINLGSSIFNINLTTAFAAGKELTVRNINSSTFLASQGLVGSGCFVNYISSTSLQTYGEQMDLYFDGTNWHGKRTIPSQWQGYTPTILGFGSSVIRHAKFRRIGDSIELDVMWRAATVEAVATSVSMPSTDIRSPNIGSSTVGSTAFFGSAIGDSMGSNTALTWVIYQPSSTIVRFGRQIQTQTDAPLEILPANGFASSNARLNLRGSMQVDGWSGL